VAGLLRDRRDAAHERAADAKDMEMHDAIIRGMGRKNRSGLRIRIAAAAARIMAEEGIDDYALAKRKAARRLGAADSEALPANEEIAAELREYLALYRAEEHPERIEELRRVALAAMRALERFSPYLTGPVLEGLAGPYAEIELQLFPESSKEVELFLLDRDIAYDATDERRYTGDRARAVAVISLTWQGVPLRLTVFDPRDERTALKTSLAGRVAARAGIAELAALIAENHGRPPA
jgi:hypothetical protein